MAAWNGLDLQTELSTTLGDTSTSFKALVLQWMNDIQDDICTRYQWPFLSVQGEKTLVQSAEVQELNIAKPSTAATNTLSASGALAEGSSYAFAVTFYRDVDGFETPAGTSSSSVTTTSGFLTASLSGIPISTESSVTGRKIYVSKDSADLVYIATIADNTTTTLDITSDTTSTVEPPDYVGIRALIGDPYLLDPKRQLIHKTEDELRFQYPGDFATGSPQFYANRDYNQIVVYPAPSDATTTMKFSYIKFPSRLYAESTSVPTMPIFFKRVFKKGVLALGYEYRERSLASQTQADYETLLSQMISDAAKTRYGAQHTRDVVGNTRGYLVR